MSKIIRTPTRAEGGLTKEEQIRMKEHTDMWIKRAMRTDPIEPDKIIPDYHAQHKFVETALKAKHKLEKDGDEINVNIGIFFRHQ